MRAWPFLLLGACAVALPDRVDDDDELPLSPDAAGCGDADVAALVRRLDAPDDVGGCLAAHVAGRVIGDGLDVQLTAFVDLGDGPWRDGQAWTVDLADADPDHARLGLTVGEDLSQNGPCSHLPFDVLAAARATAGVLTLTLVDQVDHAAAGGRVLVVDLGVEDVAVRFDDGVACAAPDGIWRGARLMLDAM